MNATDFEPLFEKVEKLIEAHPRLERARKLVDGTNFYYFDYPAFHVSRYGWSVTIVVQLKGSRKKPHEIHAEGETPEAAVKTLAGTLDHWAKAIE